MSDTAYNLFLKDIHKDDIPLVGGKGANLGEMVNAGFPVPNGFAVTTVSYDAFIKQNDLANKINEITKEVDVNSPDELDKASKKIQRIILEGEIPDDVAKDIVRFYKKLSGHFHQALVAVRSSATAEDLPGLSFAGQQATFLNVKGHNNLLVSVRECWASLFTSRAIFYRKQNKIDTEKVKISVIVQKMVESEVSGVMFSINPVNNEKDKIVIESVWGLGEMIVQGSVVPDTYIVQKETFSILSKEVSDQKVMLTRKNGENVEMEVPKRLIEKQKISDADIVKLAKYSDALQKHYYFPQDSEWALEKGKLYIVQTRPVTTIEDVQKEKAKEKGGLKDENQLDTPVLSGASASPGIGTGTAKILKSPKEIDKVKSGDVLVATMTSPDYVPAMKKAVAIVTDEGGLTSHAAIVSRELGIPCVVGTEKATKTLKENQIITVNGSKGLVFLGGKTTSAKKQNTKKELENEHVKTATRLYVNLAEPELANKVSKMNVNGVGLLRAEFMIANIGIHPKEAIQNKKQDAFIEKLEKGLTEFTKAFHPRPVVYRATDFKTNEYRSLPGGEKWEPKEANPMLGYRGAYRYVSDPEVFNLELQAIKKVRRRYKNLYMMIPFVRSPEELKRVRRLVATEGLFEDPTFKFWMMVEIPINVILIDEFIKIGIDGVSIGSNDLTMLITGTDRDNAEVSNEFNERSPAVMWALRRVIKHCNKAGVTSSICGQAPSTYDDFARKLVKYGVTSMSVNPDAVDRVRGVIKLAEEELVRDKI